jgi:dGTPase
MIHELIRRMIKFMIGDVLTKSRRAIAAAGVENSEDVRQAGEGLIRFSPELAAIEEALKRFLYRSVYRDAAVMRPVELAEMAIADLFKAYFSDPALLPAEWGSGLDPQEPLRTARRVADYIAGMTDRYALSEHQRLFDATPDLG